MDIIVKNNQIVIDRLKGIADLLPGKLNQAIGGSLYTIEGNAKSACPVDTGAVRQSIAVEMRTDGVIGGKVGCFENMNPPIAAYIEFGTGTEVQVPPGLEKYAMSFFVSGKGHLPARPFLFPAFFAEIATLTENLKKVIL